MTDLSEIARIEARCTISNMRATRGNKYEGILRGLKIVKYALLVQTRGNFAEASTRAEVLSTFYFAMRHIDDIVDGDSSLPSTETTRREYVERRMAFVNGNASIPTEAADYLLLHSFNLAERLGFGCADETMAILNSMLFDATRIEEAKKNGQPLIYTAKELSLHFHDQDISGTARGMLKIFEEDPRKEFFLKPIGNAHRISLTLQDLVTDIRAGLVNIPAEDCAKYGITQKEFKEAAALAGNSTAGLPFPIKDWSVATARRGLELIKYHRTKILPNVEFRTLGKLVLWVMYERSAERNLRKAIEAYS